MINAFSQFSLPQISTVGRRTSLGALAIGVVALVALVLLDYPLVGLGICIGLTMALGNFRLIQFATVKATKSQSEDKRRPLVMNTLGRMGVITVVALGLVFVSRPLGFGVLVGLAVFQFTLLTNVVVAMLRDAQAVATGAGATGDGATAAMEAPDAEEAG